MYIDLHTHHPQNNANGISIVNVFPQQESLGNYFSAGIHPWKITPAWNNELEFLDQKLQQSACLALGECGLDKAIETDLTWQTEVFKTQLDLNKTYQKPVIIHSVRAHQEILNIQREMKYHLPFFFHGYTKNEVLLEQILKQKNHVSFGIHLLKKQNLQTIFANLSEDELFLETDDAQIAIDEIYQTAADIRKISVERLQEIIQRNVENVLKIKF
ncbi:TatD family hydrolase [Vaginella massiliensis]|uniref:TatD family hydrolase n=1 Tax=Vaginella massiliensis TaxID=1816680 RepID=UPI003750A2CC